MTYIFEPASYSAPIPKEYALNFTNLCVLGDRIIADEAQMVLKLEVGLLHTKGRSCRLTPCVDFDV